jgi:hypothetical protein
MPRNLIPYGIIQTEGVQRCVRATERNEAREEDAEVTDRPDFDGERRRDSGPPTVNSDVLVASLGRKREGKWRGGHGV